MRFMGFGSSKSWLRSILMDRFATQSRDLSKTQPCMKQELSRQPESTQLFWPVESDVLQKVL